MPATEEMRSIYEVRLYQKTRKSARTLSGIFLIVFIISILIIFILFIISTTIIFVVLSISITSVFIISFYFYYHSIY